jgi:teichoic acid transport system ATP-binding protein
VADPMVVVDDLHVVYRVYGAGGDRGTAATALLRMIGRKTRGSIREVHAIRGISFIAYRGDAVGIIGRNGSGKSTLLRAIAGLLPPETGNVYTTGEASLLGVNAALLDDLTGERNVILGCLAMGMSKQEAKDKYQSVVDFSGVGDFIDLPMKTYSSGMGSRLRFAIAASKSHDVLLVDEALATGDAEFRVKSHARIEELRAGRGRADLQPGDLDGARPDGDGGHRRHRHHRPVHRRLRRHPGGARRQGRADQGHARYPGQGLSRALAEPGPAAATTPS